MLAGVGVGVDVRVDEGLRVAELLRVIVKV